MVNKIIEHTKLMSVKPVNSEEFIEAYVLQGLIAPFGHLFILKEEIEFDKPNLYWAEEARPL